MKRWKDVQRPILLLSAGSVAFYTIWMVSGEASSIRQTTGLLLTVLTRAAAALFLMRIVFSCDERRVKQTWRLLTVALVLFAFSDGITAVAAVAGGDMLQAPSLIDLIYLAGLLAAMAMAISYPLDPPERFGRIRELLDVGILVLAASTLAYLILVLPIIELGLVESAQTFWLSAAPLSDISLLFLFSRILLRLPSRRERWTLRLIALGFIGYLVSDVSAGYDVLRMTPGPQGLRFASIMAGSVLLMLAGMRWFHDEPVGIRFPRLERFRSTVAPRLEPLLPIAVTYVVVGYILFDWWYSQEVNWGAVFMAAILSVLLVARQGVVIGQFEMRQYAALVQSTADAAFVCDPGGQLRLANPALEMLLQRRATEDEALHLGDMVHPDETPETMLKAGREGGWVGETRLVDAAGETVQVSLSLMPVLDRSGSVQLLAGTAHDLREIVEREDALKEALDELAQAHHYLETLNRALEEKVSARTKDLQDTVEELQRLNVELQSLDRMKSEFVALVSHELRAPLTNIRAGLELISETSPHLDEETRQRLRVVEEETIRLGGFVEAILDLSALDAGRFPLDPYQVPVRAVFERVIQRLPGSGTSTRVNLDIPETIPHVHADERALESVVFHLLDNAVKYAPEGPIEVVSWHEGARVYTSVTDYGEGIPPDLREKAFEMFQRLDSSDTREIYGHGLGLHMARRFLKAMQGGIEVEDPGHQGTRIVFWLPESAANITA